MVLGNQGTATQKGPSPERQTGTTRPRPEARHRPPFINSGESGIPDNLHIALIQTLNPIFLENKFYFFIAALLKYT